MKMVNFLRLSLFLLLGAALFQSCSKDPIFDPAESEIIDLATAQSDQNITYLDPIDLSAVDGGATTRNATCDIEICATFTGTGRYAVSLPNGTSIFVDLFAQTVNINGTVFPLIGNQLCQVITVSGSSTATLAFKGTGSVVVTATINGATSVVFQAGVGTSNPVRISQAVTLTCPPVTDCEVEICANFTGTGRYAVTLPSGTLVLVDLNAQTVTINGNTFPLINNQLCQLIPLSGISTASLAFKGTGSVVVTGTWPDGTTCTLFQAGVGTTSPVRVRQDVTLTCDPPC